MKLGDILEDNVDEKYFISDSKYREHIEMLIEKQLTETPSKNIIQLGNISDSSSYGGNSQTGRIYSPKGVCPTLNTMQGGGRVPMILVEVTE